MSSTLKSSVLQLVEDIDNEELLEALRDFLELRKDAQPGKLWQELPDEKKQEILQALEEDESTLISRDDFLKPKK